MAADFTAVSPSGHTLQYTINTNDPTTVTVGSVMYEDDDAYYGALIIPETVTYNGTTYLVTKIGNAAFQNRSGLTSVSIPNSVFRIQSNAFKGCTGLTSITIPYSISSIHGNAFKNCTGLVSVYYNADSVDIPANGYYGVFLGCTNITSFIIGDSVRVLPPYLCTNLTGLTSITIPASVTTASASTFSGCTGLTTVYLNSNIETLSFSGCTSLDTIIFGDNVTEIPSHLCSGLSHLTSFTIPNTITSIGDAAFSDCTGLTSFALSNALTHIGDAAFSGCTGLTSIALPNSLTYIGPSAFQNCLGLTSVTIPESVKYIGGDAFRGNTGLTTVYYNADSTRLGYGWESNWKEEIPVGPFYECDNLTSFVFGDAVRVIPDYLCRWLNRLSSIVFPNSVLHIGDYSFAHCGGLKNSLIIPDSTISIGTGAFWACDSVDFVKIGLSVTTIDDGAFSYCSNLDSILVMAETPPVIGYGTFDYISMDIPVTVPCGTLSAYRNSSWNQFANLQVPDSCSDEVPVNVISEDGITITSSQKNVTIKGAAGECISLFDISGRLIKFNANANDIQLFGVPAKGVYLIKVGNLPARKVVVM